MTTTATKPRIWPETSRCPMRQVGEIVTVSGRRGELLFANRHTDLWAIRYEDHLGFYSAVSEKSID